VAPGAHDGDFVFGIVLVAALWHVSPEARNFVAIRKSFNSLEAAGLTLAVAMLCRNKKVPRALGPAGAGQLLGLPAAPRAAPAPTRIPS
jgi:hypothetical protein